MSSLKVVLFVGCFFLPTSKQLAHQKSGRRLVSTSISNYNLVKLDLFLLLGKQRSLKKLAVFWDYLLVVTTILVTSNARPGQVGLESWFSKQLKLV